MNVSCAGGFGSYLEVKGYKIKFIFLLGLNGFSTINQCSITSMLVFSSGEELVSERSICWCRMYQFLGTMFQNIKNLFYILKKMKNQNSKIFPQKIWDRFSFCSKEGLRTYSKSWYKYVLMELIALKMNEKLPTYSLRLIYIHI